MLVIVLCPSQASLLVKLRKASQSQCFRFLFSGMKTTSNYTSHFCFVHCLSHHHDPSGQYMLGPESELTECHGGEHKSPGCANKGCCMHCGGRQLSSVSPEGFLSWGGRSTISKARNLDKGSFSSSINGSNNYLSTS